MCAYITGPHRLAPLLWRTARVAPRPPRRGHGNLPSNHNATPATSTFVMPSSDLHPSHMNTSMCSSHPATVWEPTQSNASHHITGSSEASSGTSRPTRDHMLYHDGRLTGGRGSSDGPFSFASVHSMHEGHELHAVERGSGSGIAGATSPCASDNGMVFWDEESSHQMFVRHQGTEAPTEEGSLRDLGTTRAYTAAPNSLNQLQDDALIHTSHSNVQNADLGAHFFSSALVDM